MRQQDCIIKVYFSGIYSGNRYRVLGVMIKCFSFEQDSFLSQYAPEPTGGKNVLDIVLTSQKECVDNVEM